MTEEIPLKSKTAQDCWFSQHRHQWNKDSNAAKEDTRGREKKQQDNSAQKA